jgi:hypothetical protein
MFTDSSRQSQQLGTREFRANVSSPFCLQPGVYVGSYGLCSVWGAKTRRACRASIVHGCFEVR